MSILQILSNYIILPRTHFFVIIAMSVIICFQLSPLLLVDAYQGGSRPQYIYDKANVINNDYRTLLDNYLRQLDDYTSAEIIVYTIPSFVGHGIKSGGQEIQDRDTLANYIFNEASLDGITGIGKKGKDNGVLLLLSLSPDSSGGSMRIEVGKGLEGNITDGIAGEILDTYLVPAKNEYIKSQNITAIDRGILDTVVALGNYIGYSNSNPSYQLSKDIQRQEPDNYYFGIIIFIILFVIFAMFALRRTRRGGNYWRRSGYWGGGWYGGSSWSGGSGSSGGGSFSGGGGRSGGGGAGR
ncbi:MAG: TPM domain-containing protein [Candidatus Nitrosocosmicus sp.]